MKRWAGEDHSTTMTNGFSSPPKINQCCQQQQPDAADYFGLSATKVHSNLNNLNGATPLVAQMSEDNASVAAATQRSQRRVEDDVCASKLASASDSKDEPSSNPRKNDQSSQPSSPTNKDAGSRLRLENEPALEATWATKNIEKPVIGESIISNSIDEVKTRSGHVNADKEIKETNHDDNPREEPDEIPCLMPFLSVDSIEDMVDPLMDSDEPNNSAPKMCHNGDEHGSRELNVDDEDENDETSSVEFVSQESAIADASSSVDVENNVLPQKRRRLDHFRCNECYHSFVTESELELHTETLDVASLCGQCESSFWSPCALNRHKSEHAAAMKQLAYASGYQTDSAASFQLSRGLFADKPYACQYCGAGYTTKFNLTRHVRRNVVWPKNGQPFACDLCDATFLARCLLPIHKREKHAEFMELDLEVTEDSMNYVEATLEPEPEPELEAETVIVTPQFDLLEPECDPLEEELRPTPSTSYHAFRTATAAGISYNCKWCPEKVSSHPALIQHIVETHPDVELFRCEPCNKTFLNKAGLYGHLTHHRFQCDKCDLNFSSEDYLRQHRVVHGEDPASFPSHLSSASTTASKPPAKSTAPRFRSAKSKCDGLPYFELLARVPHMSKPFECEFCGKTFLYKTTFLEHYLTHTGERPFRCSVCGQGFIRERAMEIHESSHGGGVAPQRTVASSVSQPQHPLRPPSQLLANAANNVTEINGRRQTARKSTSSVARPSNRVHPIGRAVANWALFDPQLDVTAEDREAFYFLPVISLKMVDVSTLEDHAYVCPYCDKFFPRPTSLCGHKKICSYLTRMRAQKASAAAMGMPMPIVARKWAPRIAGVSSVGASANSPSSGTHFYARPEDSTVVIADMRHHIVFERGERIFVCGVCGKRFARKFTLSEHCRSHTTDRPFHCDRCPRAFKRKSSLFRHRRRNHAKMGAASDHQPSLAQHPMADQNWMSFEPQCNVKIGLSDDDDEDDDGDDDTPGEEDDFKPLVQLGGSEYSVQQPSFPYEYSEMSVFEPQCIVKDHVSSDEENSISNCNYYPVDDCDLIDTSMNHFLEVGLATTTMTNNGEMSSLVIAEDNTPDDGSGAGTSADNSAAWPELEERLECQQQQQQQQLAVVNRFLCGECNRRFPRREDLRRHFAEHDSVGPFKCFYCDKTFDRRKYLSKHARNHDKKKSYQCSYCERAYVTNAELTIHVRSHTGERPFKCDQCGKGFRVQKQLTLHYRTHTGEKPYACVHCPSTFSRHETLFRHNRVCQAKNNGAAAAAALLASTPPPPAAAAPSAHPLATPQLSQLLQQPPPPPLPSPPPPPPPSPPHQQQQQPQPSHSPRLTDTIDAATSLSEDYS